LSVARGIEIPVIADVSEFIGGMGDAVDAVDELGETFADVDRSAERSMDGVEDAISSAGDEGERAGKRVEASWRDALEELRTRSRKTASDVGDDTDRMRRDFDKVGDQVREVGDSARESGAEIATGLGGGIESVIGGAAEFASEAGSAFGVVGTAAGLLAAGGIALIGAEMERSKERTNDALESMLENLGAYTTAAQRLATIQQFVTEETGEWAEAQKAVNQVGVNAGDWLAAITGDVSALARVQGQLNDHLAQAKAEFEAGERTALSYQGAIENTERWQGRLNDSIADWNSTGNEAANKFRAIADAAGQLGVNADGSSRSLTSMKDIIAGIPSTVPVTVDVRFSREQAQAELDAIMSRLRRPTVAVETRFGRVAL
jgi:hypothetical protein